MQYFLQSHGIWSRTLYTFINDNVEVLNGRTPLLTETIEAISNYPSIGLGLAGDRAILNGTYPHNIFLEILVQFGIFIDTVIIALFIFCWNRGFF